MTKEEIIQMARQAGMMTRVLYLGRNLELLTNFAKLVAEHEREACAEICDGFYLTWIDIQGRYEFMGEGACSASGSVDGLEAAAAVGAAAEPAPSCYLSHSNHPGSRAHAVPAACPPLPPPPPHPLLTSPVRPLSY